MKPCILFSSMVLGLGVASCAVTEPTDSPPPAVELSEEGYSLNGPTCGNDVPEAGEVCLGLSDTLVIDTSGEQVHTVLAVDLDGDSHRDLVAMTRQRVWIRYGAPIGFGPLGWFTTPGPSSYMDVAAGDFDGDFDLDLAIADQGTGRVWIRRNNGGLAFPLLDPIAVGPSPTRILAARLAGNLRADLVVLETNADVALVLLSNGPGFNPPVAYPVGDAPDLALGDCDASGSPDLLFVNGQGIAATLQARRNFGGVLIAPVVSPLPLVDAVFGDLEDLAIVSAHLDGNARRDAVVSASHSRLPSATASGNCVFTPEYTPATMATTYAWSYRLRAVDWDVDGTQDIAAPHGELGPLPATDDHWSIVFGDGAGAFASRDVVPEGPPIAARDLAFLDVDSDDDLDVAIAARHGVIVHRNWR